MYHLPLNLENNFVSLYFSKAFFGGHIDRGLTFGGVCLAKNGFESMRGLPNSW